MALVFVAFTVIALIDLPSLLRAKNKRITIFYSLIFLVALTLYILNATGLKLPSPLGGVENLFKNVFHLSYE